MSENSNWAYSVGTLETVDQLESFGPTNPILQKKYFNILELTYLFVPQLSQT